MIGLASLIPAIGGTIAKVIDKVVPDPDLAQKLKAEAMQAVADQRNDELKGAVKIIVAEAKGDSALQRNWRPVLMLVFGALVTAHWLGFTADNLSQESINMLLTIVQIGIGGYVLGRSGEKIVKTWKGE